ncbi:hypothetical protein POM88_031570 [Heracleum sosnowskyi]|uniref:Uncharacterized protein n=1 Tax=Heracleum sosnowskyi TaxID=360622 RepID=A0AAD8MJS6_9APIA|nr:hypothetical protein POM88_031570 [Heracleum sosnowskyi]
MPKLCFQLVTRLLELEIQEALSGSKRANPMTLEDDFYINSDPSPLQLNQPITMIDCPSRVISARYINITSPKSSSFSASIFGKYYVYSFTYIVVGSLRISEMKDNCRIREAAWVSIQSPFSNVLSNISSIRDALVYGFELPWSYFYCLKCLVDHDGHAICNCSSHTDHHLWACRPYSDHVCDVAHQSSYHLSNCIGRNLHGIIQTLKDGQFEENIGIFYAARFCLGMHTQILRRLPISLKKN